MIVISVSKAYWNGANRMSKKRPTKSKPHWKVYGQENGKFVTKWISLLEVPYYKAQIRRLRKLICNECGYEFEAYVKSDKENVDCPYCK